MFPISMSLQNLIISEEDNKIKLIDLGAAADLRIGINYVPNEYLLDPRYVRPMSHRHDKLEGLGLTVRHGMKVVFAGMLPRHF